MKEKTDIGGGLVAGFDEDAGLVWVQNKDDPEIRVYFSQTTFDSFLQFVGPIWFKERMN